MSAAETPLSVEWLAEVKKNSHAGAGTHILSEQTLDMLIAAARSPVEAGSAEPSSDAEGLREALDDARKSFDRISSLRNSIGLGFARAIAEKASERLAALTQPAAPVKPNASPAPEGHASGGVNDAALAEAEEALFRSCGNRARAKDQAGLAIRIYVAALASPTPPSASGSAGGVEAEPRPHPLEIAYGALWRHTTDNTGLHEARKAVLAAIGGLRSDGQLRGVEWACSHIPPDEGMAWLLDDAALTPQADRKGQEQ